MKEKIAIDVYLKKKQEEFTIAKNEKGLQELINLEKSLNKKTFNEL
jgi:hypothetical protein